MAIRGLVVTAADTGDTVTFSSFLTTMSEFFD